MNNTHKRVPPSRGSFHIKAEVVFGSPARGCSGSGVCRLIPFHKLKNWPLNCPRFIANINWYETGSLDLTIDKNTLSEEQLQQWFSMPTFYVEQEFHFPLWLQHQFKAKNIFIAKGKYPFMVQNEEITLFFPWKKSNKMTQKQLLRLPIQKQA